MLANISWPYRRLPNRSRFDSTTGVRMLRPSRLRDDKWRRGSMREASACLQFEHPSASGRQSRKAALEVGDQIIYILEADMKPHGRPARRPGGGGAYLGAVERDGEVLDSAPGGADAEQGQRVEEGMCCGLRGGAQHDAEQAAGARVIAPPERMAGIVFERGMKHARYFRTPGEPACHLEARRL